jgi:hypothetical protein
VEGGIVPRTARRNIEAAVFAVDPRHRDQYRNRFAVGDFVGAMKAVFELPRPLGTLAFPRDSAVPTTPTAVQDVKSRLLAAFPDPALTVVTYFSLAGDIAAGTPEIRDARRAAVRVATTTAEGNAPRPATSKSVEVQQSVFDVASANGVTQVAIIAVDAVPPLIVDTVDPDTGPPGSEFTILGTDLVLQAGDDVVVVFAGQFGQRRCEVVDPTTPNAVTARVPDDVTSTNEDEEFTIILSRIDGAEVVASEDFRLPPF